ncbi:HNH endonuclease [Evansella clarkii]|uniref:HNH endonuclease n=1 Tax=Evansella clarkii TaxID=79879 RepID=UPI000B4533EE|nr:HNH endonuclease [Evansella clarkii]
MQLQKILQLIKEDKLVKFYQSNEWRALRQHALERDNQECQECRRRGRVSSTHGRAHEAARNNTSMSAAQYSAHTATPGALSPYHSSGDTPLATGITNKKKRFRKNVLHVHHKKEVKKFPELALVLDNVETLCVNCHNEEHDRLAEVNNRKPRFENEERW